MKKLFDFLTPSFLQKIDQHFLLNNRLLWISKIHYVAFFAFCVLAFSGLYMAFFPTLPFELPSQELVSISSVIVVLIGILFWAYKQISFDIEANYGQTFGFLSQSKIVLSTLSLLIFFGIVYANSLILSWKTANIVSDQELKEDIKALNLGNYFFPTNDYRDNSLLNKNQFQQQNNEYPNADGELDIYYYSHFTPHIYSKSSYDGYENWRGKDDEELKTILKNANKAKRLEIIGNYIKTYTKYGGQIKQESAEQVLNLYEKAEKENANFTTFNENPFANEILSFYAYDKSDVSSLISRIAEKKYPTQNNDGKFISVFVFSLAFMTSCLLMIYHFVRLRDLIIAAISLVCLTMASVFASVFASDVLKLYSPNFFVIITLGIYVYAFIQSMKIFKQKKYSLFSMCSLVLVSLASPFLLLWLALLGHEMKLFYLAMNSDSNTFPFLVFGGMGIYLLTMLPLFHRLLLKIKALPYI